MEPTTAENQASPLHPHEPEIAPSIDEEGRCRVCHIMVERDELAEKLGIWASEALIRQAEVRDLKAELEKVRELLGEAAGNNLPGQVKTWHEPPCKTCIGCRVRSYLEGSK